ncbi:cyclic nucleotide-binding domain-containing protein, partial [Desulfococcaceae bacterium HSG8]|nr:cyclic nucleotide-binding domain-containing protein [Desulfococcaceae bacterium HSG8]
LFSCSGCSGAIWFGFKASLASKYDNYIVGVLSRFPIFEGIEENDIKSLVSFLKLDKFFKGDFILKKGDPAKNLFIIVSGRVNVLNDDRISIASMGKGEVFGEMSLLTGVPVGATIKVVESSAILRITREAFGKILHRFPCFQMNFTRLLVQRMAEINLARSEEFSSGITGKLSEITPPDLFQTFNINRKTGVLILKLPQTSAYISFRDGKLIHVKYSDMEGKEAFFELLKQREGRFKYIPGLSPEEMKASEIGDFMHLLIEGLKKIGIDKANRKFLRTVIPTLI